MPTGTGVLAFNRPGASRADADVQPGRRRSTATLNLPSITHRLPARSDDQRLDDRHRHDPDGRRVHADASQTPPAVAARRPAIEGDDRAGRPVGDAAGRPRSGSSATRSNDTPADQGRRPRALQERRTAMAMQTVTSKDSTHIYFGTEQHATTGSTSTSGPRRKWPMSTASRDGSATAAIAHAVLTRAP